MRISEVAARAAVQPDTVRYYEREGLLRPPPRTPGGYRDYDQQALADLEFIKRAQTSGLTLKQVREVMEIASAARPPCEHVRAAVRSRLSEVEARLRDLEALRARLRATLRRLDRAPRPKAGCRCPAIESASPRLRR